MKIAIKAKFSLKFVILSQTDDSGSNWAKVDLISVLTSKNPDVFKCIPGVELSKIHLHCNIILSTPRIFSDVNYWAFHCDSNFDSWKNVFLSSQQPSLFLKLCQNEVDLTLSCLPQRESMKHS